MKGTHLSKSTRHNNASIDLPAHRVWIKLEEYGLKSSHIIKSGLNFKRDEKAEEIMDQAFESILEKLIRQS